MKVRRDKSNKIPLGEMVAFNSEGRGSINYKIKEKWDVRALCK